MRTIVVGVDASDGSAAALRWAAAEARLRDATLVIVHAYFRPLAYAGTEAAASEPEREHAGAVLDRVIQAGAGDLAGLALERRLHAGHAAHGLIEAAATADLLVVGVRGGGGFEGLVLGSTADHCAHHSPCPVVLVPAQRREPMGLVVAGVDGSRPAEDALRWAVSEATLRDAAVDVISVYEPYRAHGPFGAEFMDLASPGWTDRLREAAHEAAAAAVAAAAVPAGTRVTTHVTAGHPAEVLAERSRSADLLVVGARGLQGFAGVLLGSVSRQVIHHADCPIVVVRA
jgi:nucleotide-binding universal stress UspA family protein